MALVRTQPSAIAEPLPAPRETPLRPAFPALPLLPRARLPHVAPVPMASAHLRRCTFRLLTLLEPGARRGQRAAYAVDCLYDGREEPRPLGDLGSAHAFCDACTNTGIFRPDED